MTCGGAAESGCVSNLLELTVATKNKALIFPIQRLSSLARSWTELILRNTQISNSTEETAVKWTI